MQGAAEIARAVAAKDVKPQEVEAEHRGRIDALNPRLNALTREVHAKPGHGPLAGVPFSVKENIDLAGTPTTFGLTGDVPDAGHDAPHVAHLKAAGAVPIARGNLPDLALRWHTESARYGTTLNPHDPNITPGGSSGGDAVAVATGMVAFGVGSDYGGSLRVPAAFTKIYALRPTPGRFPMASSVPPSMSRQLFATDGLLARSVEDLKLLAPIMAQPSARDPRYTPAPWESQPQPTRVAVALANADVMRAARELELRGHEIDEIDPPHVPELAELWRDLIAYDSGPAALPRLREHGSPNTLQFVTHLLALAHQLDGPGYVAKLAHRHVLAAQWSEFLAKHPVILGPVSTEPPWPVGHDLTGREAVHEQWWGFRLTVAVNVLGLPAVSVPIGNGVQLIGARWQEQLLLDVAAELTADA
jgi:amidase